MARLLNPAKDPALLAGADLEEAALGGWHTLNPILMGLERSQVAHLLKVELLGRQRKPLLTRLHQRLAALRQQDEWEALVEAAATLKRAPAASRAELDGQTLHRFGALAWLVLELSP